MSFLHNALFRPARSVVRPFISEQSLARLSHTYTKRRYLAYLERVLSSDWVLSDVDDGPPMSQRLRLLTATLDEKQFAREYSRNQFFYDSYRQVYHFFRILEGFGFSLRRCGSILDFGCGSARILRLYRYIEGVRLVGSDANPECIAWCRQNVPGCEFFVNQLSPPLPFAMGGDFDLIVSLSVFTHIPLAQQTEWLKEMRRVLRPGGFLVCTVVGNAHIGAQLGPEGRARLHTHGEVTLAQGDASASLSTRAGGSQFDVFQRRDRVIDAFGAVLELRDYLSHTRSPIGQDLLILQKGK